MGRKNAVVGGVLMLTLATAIFALAALFSSAKWFYLVSFAARTLQGIAEAIIGCSIPSIVAIEFASDRQELYIGYVEMSMGAGLCLGPFIGAVIYWYLNYVDTFVVFTGLILGVGLLSSAVIPSRLNFKSDNSNEDGEDTDSGN